MGAGRTSRAGRIAAATVVGSVIFACFAPTQIVLRFKTNLQSRAPQTAIQIGAENAFKQGAAGDGTIGELVVVPSGKHDARVEVKVALAVEGADPNTCFGAPNNPRCVTATRSFRFADHETRTFDIFMSSACLGVPCGPGQSCNAQTGTCTDIVDDTTDPPAPTPPPPRDAGEDVVVPPIDAPTDGDPGKDASVGPCGPSNVVQGTTGEATVLVATVDALFWLDATGRLRTRAKTTATAPQTIGDDIETLTATGNTVAWTRGATAFGRTPAGTMGSCALSEAATSIVLRPGNTPNDLPTALIASGASGVIRYASSIQGGLPCQPQATLTSPPQTNLVMTASTLWGRAGQTDTLSGGPWSFANGSQWEVSTLFNARTTFLAAGPNIAYLATADQNNNAIFYQLTSPQTFAANVTLAYKPIVTGMAVDASFVYWLDSLPGTPGTTVSSRLWRAPFLGNGGAIVNIATFPPQLAAQGLVVDDNCIFAWATGAKDPSRQGNIVGIPKPAP